jgi:hypothetical protein
MPGCTFQRCVRNGSTTTSVGRTPSYCASYTHNGLPDWLFELVGLVQNLGNHVIMKNSMALVTKARPEVLALLNQAWAQLREDGTYGAIYQKWFGTP